MGLSTKAIAIINNVPLKMTFYRPHFPLHKNSVGLVASTICQIEISNLSLETSVFLLIIQSSPPTID